MNELLYALRCEIEPVYFNAHVQQREYGGWDTSEEKKLHTIITTTKPEVSLNEKHGKIYSSSGHQGLKVNQKIGTK
jgi:hypothetical protein